MDKESPAVFTIIEEIDPLWSKLTDGVAYFHGKIVSPKLDFWALRVDLSVSQICIVVRGGKQLTINNEQLIESEEHLAINKEQSSIVTLSTKVSRFVRDNDLVAGINAVPFDVVSSRENRRIQNMGIVISDGDVISPLIPHYDALVFYKAGHPRKAAITSQSLIDTNQIENAVGGFLSILEKGEPVERTLNLIARHPRSAAGVSADGGTLYLLVIDGRRIGSIGATEQETALLLRSLGSEDGINFDGGGSTALAIRYPDGKVRIANTPIHGRVAGRERAVAGCIGVFIQSE